MAGEADGLVAGHFAVGGLLGSGGTASVFAATDVRSGRRIALKVLHPHLALDAAARDAFVAEARAAASVRSANVVQVLEVGFADDDEAWIAMELVPGVSLAEAVERLGPLGLSAVVGIAEGVLLALEATHEVGLVHGDVSPGNVMVELGDAGEVQPGGVRLIDFGIAGASAGGTDGEVRGNPAYVSPEQAGGRAVDGRSDLYQLGGVLHFALTGRPPFVRDTVEAVLEAHRSAPQPVPSVLRPGVPRELDRLVVRAMVKHPDGRFGSAATMLEAVLAASITAAGGPALPGPGAEAAPGVLGAPTELTRVLGATSPSPRSVPAARTRSRAAAGPWLGAALVVALIGGSWLLAAHGSPVPVPTATPTVEAAPAAEAPPPPPRSDFGRVPAVEGVALDAARAAVEQAGFTVGGLTIQDAAVAGDTVLGSSPGAGAVVALGSAIELVVASGSNAVPAVLGMPYQDAVAAIEAAGLAARVRFVDDDSATPATVLGATPARHTIARLGTLVELVATPERVAPEPTPSASPTPTPAPTP